MIILSHKIGMVSVAAVAAMALFTFCLQFFMMLCQSPLVTSVIHSKWEKLLRVRINTKSTGYHYLYMI